MPDSTNNPSAASSVGSNSPSSSAPQIPDLVETRQRWDDSLEASFAKIKEIMRRNNELHSQAIKQKKTHDDAK